MKNQEPIKWLALKAKNKRIVVELCYDIITISLEQYREKRVKMYCEKTCENY